MLNMLLKFITFNVNCIIFKYDKDYTVLFIIKLIMDDKCYELLKTCARTFAPIIQSLDPIIKEPLCVMYLILKALDTIEDDPSLDYNLRVTMLRGFHDHLYDTNWAFNDSKDANAILLSQFSIISKQFTKLSLYCQYIIREQCRNMGEFMANYLNKPIETIDQYNDYCYNASGLVYVTVDKMFVHFNLSSCESIFCKDVGMLLQKTNIIRDYLDDVSNGRCYWPKTIWVTYVSELRKLSKPKHKQNALKCLNILIHDALSHLDNVVKYLATINNKSIFMCCAIPTILSVATLSEMYNNINVFTTCIKLDKDKTIEILSISNYNDIVQIYEKYIDKIKWMACICATNNVNNSFDDIWEYTDK